MHFEPSVTELHGERERTHRALTTEQTGGTNMDNIDKLLDFINSLQNPRLIVNTLECLAEMAKKDSSFPNVKE